jgi:hypothetical protein
VELDSLLARVEREALDDTPLARIACAGMLSAELAAVGDQVVDHFIDAARREGCSWAQIGSALGVTRQAAQQRHGMMRRLVTRPGRRSPAIMRFGPDARQAVVEAQNAARALGSGHVDAEHLLVGILRSHPRNAAAQVLTERGLSPELVGEEIGSPVGRGRAGTRGRIPFAPAAKKVLELSLREALALGATHIGTEHLLLAVIEEHDGAAARLLARHGVERDDVLAALDSHARE